jgi:hypothetical protein
MKKKLVSLLFMPAIMLFAGCIAFPPLISVQHKEDPTNKEVVKRLDAIDQRLSQLEQKTATK